MIDMYDKLKEIYAKIPQSKCENGCFECCKNLIQFSEEEKSRMGGYEYNGVCSHLVDGKCTVYDSRPLVCRIFGTSEILRCDSCEPEGFLGKEETLEIMKEYAQLRKNEDASGNK